jgi:uncharacterized protein (DUF2267 family)
MTHSAHSLFDSSLQKTIHWIDEVAREMKWDDRLKAYHTMRTVMHVLRDRLRVDQAAHLSAQLPLIVRGIFFEGWKPARTPLSYKTKEEMKSLIKEYAQVDYLHDQNLETAIRAVLTTIRNHIDPNEIEDILSGLPEEIKEFFPS